jgi:phosphate transport system substrate-binding protein
MVILFSIIIVAVQPDTVDEDVFTDHTKMNSFTPSEEGNTSYTGTVKSTLFIKGSDTVLPISLDESEAYTKLYPEKNIVVIGGGSSLGIASFIEGEVEIAMASRKMKESEYKAAVSNGIEPVETIIAWDGISVIINKDNLLESLSMDQLKMIYTGEITNWKEVGGNDENIKVLIRDSSSGTYGFFKEHVLLDKEYTIYATTEPNTEAVVRDVASDTSAIGYIGLAYMDDSVKMAGLAVEGEVFYPEADSIRKGEYPLSRPLYYYANKHTEENTKDFIGFVLSEEGQKIIADVGYLPVN